MAELETEEVQIPKNMTANNKSYFAGTAVVTKDEAQAIKDAIAAGEERGEPAAQSDNKKKK